MTMLNNYSQILAMTVLVFTVVSCDTTNNSNPKLDLIPLNSITVNGYNISLEANNELETGANDLYWKVQQDANIVDLQSISIEPLMDMGHMMHSTPYNQPTTAEEDDRYYKNMAVFIMPGGEMGSWSINFEITTQNGEVISGEMPIDVASSWKLTSVRDADDRIYFISWYAPQEPVVGNNELMYLVHTRETMMNFPAVEDIEMEVFPYMDMGGGSGHSTDYSTPVPMGNGFYEGDINYSMSGTWTTSVELIIENDTLPEVVFEYSVQAK